MTTTDEERPEAPADDGRPDDAALLVAARAQAGTASGILATAPEQTFWTPQQVATLHTIGVPVQAPPADLALFFHQCTRTGLDPFARQIYLIYRNTWDEVSRQYVYRPTIQTGIDGYRVVRDRVAERMGQEFSYEDTVWYDAGGGEHTVWLDDDAPPAACKVVFVIDGTRRFPAVVRFWDYAALKKGGTKGVLGDLVAQWKQQGAHMIEKCAEAFALRRAYPHDLSGTYIVEEMQRADGPPAKPAARRSTKPAAPGDTPTPVTTPVTRTADPLDGQVVAGAVPAGQDPVPDTAPPRTGIDRVKLMRKLHRIMRDAGFGEDREAKIAICRVLARVRPDDPMPDLETTSALSDDQVVLVVDKLEGWAKPNQGEGDADRKTRIRDGLSQLAARGGWAPQADPPAEGQGDDDA